MAAADGAAVSLQIARYTKVQLCQKKESLKRKNVASSPSPGHLLSSRFVPPTNATEKDAGPMESMNCR